MPTRIKDKKTSGWLAYAVVAAVLALTLTNVVASNSLVNSGREVEDLERMALIFERQNLNLRQTILEYTSLTHFKSQAQKLGFEPATLIVQLRPLVRVASR